MSKGELPESETHLEREKKAIAKSKLDDSLKSDFKSALEFEKLSTFVDSN